MEEIFLNLIPTGVRPVCHASQYDVGRTIKVNLFEGSVAYALQEGDNLVLDIRKPNDEIVSAELSVTVGEVYAYIVTVEEMCDIVGRNTCELRLKNGTKDIGTLNFYIEVEEAVGEVEPLPPPTPPTPTPTEPPLTSVIVTGGIGNNEYQVEYSLEVEIV